MAMVSSSLGPINSLLGKLPAEPEFRDLRYSLEGIRRHLLQFSAPGVERTTLVCGWMTHLRELAYDVDDWIDGLVVRSWGRFKLKWWPSHQLAQIREFTDQIRDMQDRATSFGLPGCDLVASEVTMDLEEDDEACEILQNSMFLYGKMPRLVGLDGPERELACHIMDDVQGLKVVCILGRAGLGKTTLAREVFQKQRNQFDCGAFIFVGRNPSVEATLMDIARQVMPMCLFPRDGEKHVATKLWEFLGTKRYFIVIDDIWSVHVWSAIRSVLRENDLGSRVLVTTEIKHISNSCCVKHIDFVHLMKPLSNHDSRSLILSMISYEDRPVNSDILQSMVKLCGGTPLAIVVAGGLLAVGCGKLAESPLNEDSTSLEMQMLFDISYGDLHLHLKSCLLYLSIFPENYIIKKDRLIRRWVAEGFIPLRNEESLWEIGERYFNELACRGLIQLVFDDNDDQPIGCTVHHIIRDFILCLSCQGNFLTVGAKLSSRSYTCDTVHRLSLDCIKQDEVDGFVTSPVRLSRVRSFTVFGNAEKCMPDLSAFKRVRVLDLEGTKLLEYHQLKSIGRLSLLRYLGLQGTGVTMLPKQIMVLEHLNTLDLQRTKVIQLPEFRTVNLAALLIDRLQLQRGMGEMRYLEELSMISVSPISSPEALSKIHVHGTDSLDNLVQLISKSKQLRILAVRFDGLSSDTKTYRQVGVMHFLEELAESSIKSLILHDYPHSLIDLLVGWACTSLKKFELRIDGQLSKIPQKMASLIHLTHLHIKVNKAEGLYGLGKLPNLILLNLTSEFGAQERCTITRDYFRSLKMFSYNCFHHGMDLQFGPGAMPHLQSLQISFEPLQTKSCYGNFDFAIQYLSHLARVYANINCCHATALEAGAAEAAIRQQISQISISPLLELSRQEHE